SNTLKEAETESESGKETEKESEKESVKEKEGDTTVIVNLDAQAIDKLKNAEPEKESSPLNELVLVEDNSMDIITLWERFTGFCASVRRFCSENSGRILFLFAGVIVTGILVRILRFFCDHVIFARIIKKTQTLADDHIYRASLPPVLAFFWLLGLLASAMPLLEGAHYPQRLILALIAADVTWLLYRLIGAADHIVCLYFRGKQWVFNKLIFDAIRKTLRIALVLFAVCFIGQAILRFNVSALLAAAGIFGLAIAFAVKDTISNFLSSFMMLFDRSFQIGDRIRAGNIDGDVEAVDFRSTRIRALNGHLYSIPNAILGVGIIENVSQRPGIRYDFQLGLTYDTKPEQMKKAVEIVRELVSDPQRYIQSPARNLVSFGSFGDWSLNIHGLIWFNTQNYVQSELWKHDLHMAILERFSAEGLEFAFPTQTVSITKTQEK
ncbi:MAG: mechanosensitive ion channel family protein, partial [Planctomycetia bacterium]|nr:mechanosensitive ion channel family protein [Planctomycetia bacterium]